MNLYQKLKKSQQERINDFLHVNAFFAFSEKQFKEGVKKLGIPEGATGVLVPLGNTGGFILKEKVQEYKAIVAQTVAETQAALDDPDTGADFAYQMFFAELANHEYSYTGSTWETLDALGYTLEEVDKNPVLKAALAKACKDLLEEE